MNIKHHCIWSILFFLASLMQSHANIVVSKDIAPVKVPWQYISKNSKLCKFGQVKPMANVEYKRLNDMGDYFKIGDCDAHNYGNRIILRTKIPYYVNVPVAHLEPPKIAHTDYYSYFNRRRKLLRKNKKRNQDISNSMQSQFINEKNRTSDNTKNGKTYGCDRASKCDENVTSTTEAPRIQKAISSANENMEENSLELSPDGDRVEFQVQGHKGPKTYIFGFDTGNGDNRQYRLEEKFNDGSVKGHYGYHDAKGKLRIITYTAKPAEGYVEKHHETIIRRTEN